MKVNVWWLTSCYPNGEKVNTLYYSEDLNKCLESSRGVRSEIELIQEERCTYESSHYGIFEYSKIDEIAKQSFNGRLFNAD